jgi:glycerophosphoryl diester phosphodiesterase
VFTAGVNATPPAPRTGFGYLDEVLDPPASVLAMAHRGGGKHPDLPGLENTLTAFRHAVDLGYRYLETDVHATSDGVLVAIHDAVLDRVADLPGTVLEMTMTDLEVARIAGREPVPTLVQLLEEFPECRFNIDIKAETALDPLVDLLRSAGAEDRVCVGRREALALLTAHSRARASRVAARGGFGVLQLPRVRGPVPVVTRPVVRRAHAAGVHVHAWTVDEPAHMLRMLDVGVDGIFTDRTDLLRDVLTERGLWRVPQ